MAIRQAPPASPAVVRPSGEDRLEESTRLRGVLLKLSRRLRAGDAGDGLTPAEYALLAAAVRRGPVRSAALADLEGLNPTMVSRLLARLCADGLLERSADPEDRRGTLVRATPAGRHRHERARRARASALALALDGLDDVQRAAILAARPALESLERLLDGRSG